MVKSNFEKGAVGLKTPLVLVVIPLYNAREYFRAALESILTQTYGNLQILVINDGSTDGSETILQDYQDKRINLWNQENLGPGIAMNRAIKYAHEQGIEFIARQDADDISMPGRLEKQVMLMLANTTMAACSANCYYIDPKDERIIGTSTISTSIRMIKWEISHGLRGLIQPAVIFRTSALIKIGGYDPKFKLAEETDLFLRLNAQHDFINSDEYLVKIRLNAVSLSMKNPEQNINYQVYALYCAKKRRGGNPPNSYTEFMIKKSPRDSYRIWREITFLKFWRRYMVNKDILPLILAGIVDPRRVYIRVSRNIFS